MINAHCQLSLLASSILMSGSYLLSSASLAFKFPLENRDGAIVAESGAGAIYFS